MKSEDRSSYQQILKATSIFGGVKVFSIIISIIRSKVVAILLGPSGMGIVGLLTSTTGLISSLTNFGLGRSAVKDIAEAHASNNKDRIAKVSAVFKKLVWITGIIGTIVTLILSPLLSEFTFGNKNYTLSFALLSVTLLLGQLKSGQFVILQGTRRIRYLASANMVGSVLTLVITIPLYYFFSEDGIVPAIILMALATFFVSNYYQGRVDIPKVKVSKTEVIEEGKGMLKLGFVLSLNGFITALGAYVLRVYISNSGGLDDVGLYSAGFQIIGTYVGLVFTAMGKDYFPRLSGVAHNDKERNTLVNQQGEIAILILFPIVLVFMVYIPIIVELLYSSKFLPINIMIIWAAFAMFFKAVSWAIAFQFLAKGSSKLFFFNELATKIYLLGFNILGFTYFGLTGLGYSFLLTYIVYTIQVYFMTYYHYGYSINRSFFRTFILVIIVCTFCLVLVLLAPEIYKYIFGSLLIIIGSAYSIFHLNDKTGFLDKIKWRRK